MIGFDWKWISSGGFWITVGIGLGAILIIILVAFLGNRLLVRADIKELFPVSEERLKDLNYRRNLIRFLEARIDRSYSAPTELLLRHIVDFIIREENFDQVSQLLNKRFVS